MRGILFVPIKDIYVQILYICMLAMEHKVRKYRYLFWIVSNNIPLHFLIDKELNSSSLISINKRIWNNIRVALWRDFFMIWSELNIFNWRKLEYFPLVRSFIVSHTNRILQDLKKSVFIISHKELYERHISRSNEPCAVARLFNYEHLCPWNASRSQPRGCLPAIIFVELFNLRYRSATFSIWEIVKFSKYLCTDIPTTITMPFLLFLNLK